MKMPWQKDSPSGETEEQKKQREQGEEQEFFKKIGLAVEEKLAPVRDTVTKLQDDWTKLQEAATQQDDGTGGGDDATLSEEEKRRKNDELDKRKLLALTIATNARITEGEVLQEVHAKYPEFEPKIKEIFLNTAIERKGQADYGIYCRNVMTMVIGQAALSGGLKYDAGSKRFFLEDAGGGNENKNYDFLASDMTWTDPKSGRNFSGREQLAKLGIKPEEFQESIDKGIV